MLTFSRGDAASYPAQQRLCYLIGMNEPSRPTQTPIEISDLVAPQVQRGDMLTSRHLRSPRRRRLALPIFLFVITCVSTFWAGASNWQPLSVSDGINARRTVLRHWDQGLTYMGCVLAILLAHEMGHFLATVKYRIPASVPIFIPCPITPIGTMGAVIAMDGRSANRREIFDIGLAGPLAGLIVAIPILWIGVQKIDPQVKGYGNERYDCPVIVEWMGHWIHPGTPTLTEVRPTQINAYFMAGWVGLLITGLNMLPVSQLDGGHVIYALFGRRAHVIARTFIFIAILFAVFGNAIIWSPMIILVILLGTDHPPTANDFVELGFARKLIGYASLIIPVLCFPPYGITLDTF